MGCIQRQLTTASKIWHSLFLTTKSLELWHRLVWFYNQDIFSLPLTAIDGVGTGIFSYRLMPRPGIEPTSAELHRGLWPKLNVLVLPVVSVKVEVVWSEFGQLDGDLPVNLRHLGHRRRVATVAGAGPAAIGLVAAGIVSPSLDVRILHLVLWQK